MTFPKLEIPILHQIADLARQYAPVNPDLAKAFEELDQCWADRVAMRAEMLEHRGVECLACGKRFVHSRESMFCSIGCQYGDI